MSDPFIGEIRMFAGNFAPRSWALCDGQLLAVSQNDALFSLLGTAYGGDGRTTFGLPDMRGRIPVHQGQGPGLTDRRIGSRFGSEQETLVAGQLPSHNHAFQASSDTAISGYPQQVVVAETDTDNTYNADATAAGGENFDSSAITNAGGGQAHNNIMPFQCVNFIIALFGIYPSRT
jgi:microcystin-dependent protein